MNSTSVTHEDIKEIERLLEKLKNEKADLSEIFQLEDKCAGYYISKMELKDVMEKINKS
jgi:Ca2+-binding EF-hand superfamily protein